MLRIIKESRKPNRSHHNAIEKTHFGRASGILCAVLILPSQKAVVALEKVQRITEWKELQRALGDHLVFSLHPQKMKNGKEQLQ